MAAETRRRKEPSVKTKPESVDKTSDEVKPKYGPLPKFRTQRVWARGVMLLGVLAVVYFSSKPGKEVTFATYKETYNRQGMEVVCAEDFSSEVEKFAGCAPKRCGRLVSDNVVTLSEAAALLEIAKRGLAVGRSGGGASILDLHSGAVSYDQGFINLYKLGAGENIFKPSDFAVYKLVKSKIKHAIADHFDLDTNTLYLTHPTFFSRLTNKPPMSVHDEYWHTHVDKETYKAFHYTSLLYLTDYKTDFEGGRFVFVDKNNVNRTVEPKTGRVSIFTSGSENTHFVERVQSGVRYAITVSFTCDQTYAISDPQIQETEE